MPETAATSDCKAPWNDTAMMQPTESKPSRLASALAGGKGRPTAPRADEAFDKEVDEELQREWFNKLWEQYSGYILGAAVALVLGIGAYKLIEHRQQAAAEAAGARYLAAIKSLTGGKTDEGTQALGAVAKAGGGGFATVAQLRLAAADAAAGKTADAVAKYDTIARDRFVDPLLQGFARLQTAMLSLDTASWDDMQSRLASLTSDTSPWRYNASELLGLAAMKAGKTEAARLQFERLVSTQGVPPGIAERARIVMGSIVAAELAAKPLPTATPAAAPTASPVVTPKN